VIAACGGSKAPAATVARAPVAEPAQAGPDHIRGRAPLSCFVDKTSTWAGACDFGIADCERLRTDMDSASDTTPCADQTAGACFRVEAVLTGTSRLDCAPSMRQCIATRESHAAIADFRITSDCIVYRYEP
jgi:hypothetical protein